MTPFLRKGHPSAPPRMKRRPGGDPSAEPDGAASVIARGMTLVGDCSSRDTIRVEGRVDGDIRSDRAIVVAKNGVVVGDILARDAVISGRVRGRVETASSIELKASCVVDGEIDTLSIAVEKGALINVAFKTSSEDTRREDDTRRSSEDTRRSSEDTRRSSEDTPREPDGRSH